MMMLMMMMMMMLISEPSDLSQSSNGSLRFHCIFSQVQSSYFFQSWHPTSISDNVFPPAQSLMAYRMAPFPINMVFKVLFY